MNESGIIKKSSRRMKLGVIFSTFYPSKATVHSHNIKIGESLKAIKNITENLDQTTSMLWKILKCLLNTFSNAMKNQYKNEINRKIIINLCATFASFFIDLHRIFQFFSKTTKENRTKFHHFVNNIISM